MREAIPSALDAEHDIVLDEFGFGVDICQNGTSIHVGHDQIGDLIDCLSSFCFEEKPDA